MSFELSAKWCFGLQNRLRSRLRFFVTGGDDRRHCRRVQGKRKLKVRRTLECAIPALPTHGCRVLRQRAGKGNLLGPSIWKSAQASGYCRSCFAFRRCKLEAEIVLQETAHSAKTIILDASHQRLVSGAGWQSGIELCRARATSLKLL
jgi:hypothetical protein